MLNSLPLEVVGVLGSRVPAGPYPSKARIFVERSVVVTPNPNFIPWPSYHGFSPPRLDSHDYILRVGIDEEVVLVGVGFVLAAVMFLLFGVIL